MIMRLKAVQVLKNHSPGKTICITGGDDVCALLNNNAIPDDIVNIYVPEGLVEQYKEENWSEFADRIEKLPEEV